MLASQWHLFIIATVLVKLSDATSNPFIGQKFYVNPANEKEYDLSIPSAEGLVKTNLELMQQQASAYWIDVKSKIRGNTTGTVEGILASASSKSPPELVVLIWYDLPNRDCDAHASNGEICCTKNTDGTCNYDVVSDCADGLKEYETEYVDPFIQVLKKYTGKLPIVIVFEPDSLPNLATNLGNPHCANEATQHSYKEGTKHALDRLASETDATVYIDAGHGGWLGWSDNLVDYLNILKSLDLPVDKIRGFSTDVSGYQPLGIMCPWEPDTTYRNGYCLNGKHQDDPCCYDPCALVKDWDPANNELNYAQELHMAAKGILGMDAHIITDTGRNGVSDMRADCADWCNIRGAGAGIFPTSDVPNPDIVDAYYWLKTPGESDGCTKMLPDGNECPRFDKMCGSEDSIGSRPGEPRAPEAGQWFDYQVKQLAANARFTMPSTSPPSSTSNPPNTSTPAPSTPAPSPPSSPSKPPSTNRESKCCWSKSCSSSVTDTECHDPGTWCAESKENCDQCSGKWCPRRLLGMDVLV